MQRQYQYKIIQKYRKNGYSNKRLYKLFDLPGEQYVSKLLNEAKRCDIKLSNNKNMLIN